MPHGEVVGGDIDDGLADFGGVFGGGVGEGVVVGDDEVAVVLVLEGEAVFERADVVAEVEAAGGGIAGEDAGLGGGHGGSLS